MSRVEHLLSSLPDPDSACRFLDQFREKDHGGAAKLEKNAALLSDVLTLASFSPLLATTLLQNPSYVSWLGRQRADSKVRGKEELLESLARFSLTNSLSEPHVLYARFRRRELMRIFLSDVRRLSTVAEVTEDISNLADTILESALRHAKQEVDNRYGPPLETDERGKKRPAEMCIVALGKLGSKELNYSSDIDLLFLYSAEGTTAGTGAKGTLTNREYFIKLAESVVRLVGQQTGEGAAYRVDMRLRPHGRVGPLAMSTAETIRYYRNDARMWERQVLIRSRASAGDSSLYREFFQQVEDVIFSKDETVENALRNVRASKQLINAESNAGRGLDIKLGAGGIREIEFIAQALQLAYGGKDKWLRVPHTLISLARLADRGLITDHEMSDLSEAYKFLRRLEHILQMEQGLQTHLLPADGEKRTAIAKKVGFATLEELDAEVSHQTGDVTRIFDRLFEHIGESAEASEVGSSQNAEDEHAEAPLNSGFLARAAHSSTELDLLSDEGIFSRRLSKALDRRNFAGRLAELRQQWRRSLDDIKFHDMSGSLDVRKSKRLQTSLAEASIEVALTITRDELAKRFRTPVDRFALAILALGKLGSAQIDYDSDLDIILVYDETIPVAADVTHAEFYSRAAEIFVTSLSGITREGSLYRVDLRLRPYGTNGPSVVSRKALREYLVNAAAVWELLAYIKLRGVYSMEADLAYAIESECTKVILQHAKTFSAEALARETREMRLRLERERARSRRSNEIDIKYGPGGMLDIYFAIRYLQLRDSVGDEPGRRTSDVTLDRLLGCGSVSHKDHEALAAGYKFLSEFDHALRLHVGRTTKVPTANAKAMNLIAARMNLSSSDELLAQLTLHRLEIRQAFDNILTVQL